jgi:hypothetical protein
MGSKWEVRLRTLGKDWSLMVGEAAAASAAEVKGVRRWGWKERMIDAFCIG